MSQEIEWGTRTPDSSIGPHRDYDFNLRASRGFCNTVTNKLPEGMRVYIASSQWLSDNLLMFSWNPGRYEPIGNYAHPISLHQAREEVRKQADTVYQYFLLKIGKFLEKKSLNCMADSPKT
jgi:hypothetical protein